MAEHCIVEIENAPIVLSCTKDPFSDGLTTSYLEFYDEWHQPYFPLVSQVIRDHLLTILNEPFYPCLWKAGRVTDWIEALMENCHQTFRSFIPVQCIVHETLQVRRANARIVNKGFTISEPKTPKSRRSIQLAQMTIDALKRHRIRQHELRLRRFSQSYHSLS